LLVLVRLAQVLGGEVLMWIVAVGLGAVRVLVCVLVPEVLKASDPLDEVVRQVVMRMLVPDGFVLMFWPTRLPSSHSSSSARPHHAAERTARVNPIRRSGCCTFLLYFLRTPKAPLEPSAS